MQQIYFSRNRNFSQPTDTQFYKTDPKTCEILHRRICKLVIFVWKYTEKQFFFVETTFWENLISCSNLMHHLFIIFINFLYMFRAILCSSSGGFVVYIQHLVLCMSLFLGDRSVHRQLEDWLCQSSNCLWTERSPKKSDIQRTRCCMYTMNPPDDEHNIARNM